MNEVFILKVQEPATLPGWTLEKYFILWTFSASSSSLWALGEQEEKNRAETSCLFFAWWKWFHLFVLLREKGEVLVWGPDLKTFSKVIFGLCWVSLADRLEAGSPSSFIAHKQKFEKEVSHCNYILVNNNWKHQPHRGIRQPDEQNYQSVESALPSC